MTKEQEKATKNLQKLVELRKDKTNEIKYDSCICSTKELDITLNLLQKQQAELERKDKIIDEIYKCFYKIWCKYPGSGMKILKDNGFNDYKCSICETKTTNCIDCIKQYFEKKVSEE